jgi:hypothetical protein
MNRLKGVLKGNPLSEEELEDNKNQKLLPTILINNKINKNISKTIQDPPIQPLETSPLVSVRVDECEMLMNCESTGSNNLAKRRSDIQNVHKEVSEIKDMFEMIHEMIDEQGESIDMIENNVISAKQNIEESEIILETTEKYKSIGDKIKCGGLGLVCFAVSVPLGIYVGTGAAVYTLIAGTGLGGYALLKK